MKRTTLLYSTLALLLGFTACTQDDLSSSSGELRGTPMTFTATGLTPSAGTRATVDGDWEGVSTVAIQIGSEVKEYRVTLSTDNLTATLSSDDPHYWAAGDTVTTLPPPSAAMTRTTGRQEIPSLYRHGGPIPRARPRCPPWWCRQTSAVTAMPRATTSAWRRNCCITTEAHPHSPSRTAPHASSSQCREAHQSSAPCA